MSKLIIARHHESEWNRLGLWTGKRDRHLTDLGFEKSGEMGKLIANIHIDYAFASMQVRSIETLSCMLDAMEIFDIPIEHLSALNERDYGDYTGKNKWDMEKVLGEEGWNNIRRGWDVEVPHGETLKMVYARVVSCFEQKILPRLAEGSNVLIVAHGNSLRALVKFVENISDADIEKIEMPFGTTVIYDIDSTGHMISKEVRTINPDVISMRSEIL
jgi:2,3-bisphosphoglycerate-dependent phosphoglycerate mutase